MNKIRVLILEDDRDIIELLTSIMEPAYECFSATNGLEGLQSALSGEPDLVICDIMMPVMDGKEFIGLLQKRKGYENLPVIFLSALSSRDQIKEGYELGAALYLTKPIDPPRFKRNLELFIGDRRIESRPKRKTIEELKYQAYIQHRQATSKSTGVEYRSRAGSASETPTPPAGVTPRPGSVPQMTRSAPGAAETARVNAVQRTGKLEQIANRELKKGRVGTKKIRLLVVDDDRDTQTMLRSGLSEHFEVLEARDGIVAIEHAVRYKPDIFIIDGMLPRMTGYQLTMMLRKNRDFYRTPIVFVSGKATSRDQQYVQKLGISSFLAKPFTVKQIEEALGKIVKADGFAIREDRVDLKQVQFERFQRMETHRKEADNLEHIE